MATAPVWLLCLVVNLQLTAADVDNVFPIRYSTNPVARHVACAVPAGAAAVCTLSGFDNETRPLEFLITSLPGSGTLYETSQNYRTYGSDPKYAPTPIQIHEIPFRVSDPLHRIVYMPPSDIFPPEGRWAAVTYTVQEPQTGELSMPAQVAFSSPDNYISASSYIGGSDGWTIAGNIHATTPVWQAFGWGVLNRYIYSADEVQYLDWESGSDRSKWYFEAPPGKFCLPEVASSYGGKIKLSIASTYGDFEHLNSPLDFITLDCASCNSGRGMRIVRYDEWDGRERVVEVPLTPPHWMLDPMNQALPIKEATECEIAAVLAGLTRFRILGDFTKAGEGVAIDDVSISSAEQQPKFPLACQQGCNCAHDSRWQRISCCGS